MNKEFILALEALEKEKNVSKDLLVEAIESALVSAYKKNYGTSQNVRVNVDRESGDIDVFMRRDVVEEVWDPFTEVSIEEAQEIDPAYEIGDVVEYQVTPRDFGRIAAQTAKQVVVQRIREAERGMIYDDYINRQSEVVNGIVQRMSNDTLFVSIGKAEGILAPNEQVKGERYGVNDRIKVYIMDVKRTSKGPQVYLSRSHPGMVKRLFELEVPEIQEGIVEIKSVSREAGSRTKMAVYTHDEGVDPVGACVGTRGSRVQAVVDELNGEKIDIINWSEDPGQLISSALSPAKVEKVLIDEDEKAAIVVVPDYQLSLAIGKEGQNVRLAAKLCGWKIDIKSHTQFARMEEEEAWQEAQQALEAAESELDEANEAENLSEATESKEAEQKEEQTLTDEANETDLKDVEEETKEAASDESEELKDSGFIELDE